MLKGVRALTQLPSHHRLASKQTQRKMTQALWRVSSARQALESYWFPALHILDELATLTPSGAQVLVDLMDQFTDTNDVDELRETAAAACQLLASVGLPTQTPDLLLFPVSRADASWPQRKAAYEQLESKVTTASFGGSTVDPWMSIQALEQYLATSTPTPQQQVQRLHAGVTNKFGFDPQLHQARNIGHSRAVTWFLRATSCSAPTSASAHALLSAPTTAVFAQTASLHAAAMLAETADNSSLGSLVNSCRVDASRELLTSMHESMLPASVRIEETETLPQKPTKKVLKKAESAVPAPMSKSLPKKEATATTARKKFVSDSAKPGTEVKKAPAKKKPAKKAPAESSDEVSSSDSELEVPAKAAKKGFGQAAPTSRASTTAPAGGANTDGPMRDLAWKPHSLGLLVLVSRSMAPSTKVAAFDMDSTLIQPKSNSKFPTNRADWKWLSPNVPSRLKQLHDSGYKIVIFTNQSGISKGHQRAEDITGKILDMANEIQVPIHAFVSTANDIHRKPGTAMWDIFITYNGGVIPSKDSSFFVGDAAGRFANPPFRPKKDFSCTDRAFAHNIGIKFQTESEFFFGAKQEKFEWDSLDPATLGATVGQQTSNVVFTKPTQELVIMLGYPGSGKSTFSKKNFVAAGYVHVNQDTLKSQQNCMSATHSALASGKSVVVDNTNPSVTARQPFIHAALARGVPVRCFWITTTKEVAQHMNAYRVKSTGAHMVPEIAYNMFRSKFQEPTKSEGFSEVVQVPPSFVFDTQKQLDLFLQRT